MYLIQEHGLTLNIASNSKMLLAVWPNRQKISKTQNSNLNTIEVNADGIQVGCTCR